MVCAQGPGGSGAGSPVSLHLVRLDEGLCAFVPTPHALDDVEELMDHAGGRHRGVADIAYATFAGFGLFQGVSATGH